ncbi:hypothetical protein FDV58_33720 [Bradyrhizobium elkanii]|uniref:Uncharacterized protein n=1 Tax=Bradyrhizobium elkanii TaxID=29448 RepID=A0A4U6RI81_BRAEL|nr:hypothetical protein FDV58_33720 [Bradyrhizobium elkanii]
MFRVACRKETQESTLIAEFDTRHAAELAVKHVMQESGVQRTDVFVQKRVADALKSAGVKVVQTK